jgi:hypothetical protein
MSPTTSGPKSKTVNSRETGGKNSLFIDPEM